jgi:GntR family carbon starvation induced transcriptional regulator
MPEPISAKLTEASLVTARLRAELVQGVMRPGDKLKLEPLARRYAVSRGPLREAASRLAAEGLITIEDHRGFRVAPLSRADLLDVTATRQRIEVLALQDAIAHGDLAWEGRVKATCHVLERVTGGEAHEFARHHQAFHEALVAACPSQYLLDFRVRLYALTERYRNLAAAGYAAGRARRDVGAEHRALAEAAVARDAERAAALLSAHLAETARLLFEAHPELFGGRA